MSSLEEQIQKKFIEKKMTLSLAESCTGGEIAARLTKIPGSSAYFKGGIVAYHTQSKIDLLEVPNDIILKYSVVSKQVAEIMAKQVKAKYKTDIGIATTGNAGPLKGDSDVEIGTVWIAIATVKGVLKKKVMFGKHRERVIGKAVNKALEMVYREIT